MPNAQVANITITELQKKKEPEGNALKVRLKHFTEERKML